MKTKQPVTLSGWYELEDGRIQYHYWKDGQLMDGQIVNDWSQTHETEPWFTDPIFEPCEIDSEE